MERLSYQLIASLNKHVPVHVIANRRGRCWLPFFFVTALIRSVILLRRKRIQIIHVGDPLLAPIGLILRVVHSVPVVVTVHGLDIVYERWFYQRLIPPLVARADAVISISKQVRSECLARGVPAGKIWVIPIGVAVSEESPSSVRKGHAAIRGLEEAKRHEAIVLLSVGRLIRRKGVARFVANILPMVVMHYPGVVYVVVGKGPERNRIMALARARGLAKNVLLFGEIDDQRLAAIYGLADIFVMPNVPVVGDMEGFGIVALEACVNRLPVVASRLEGITDAITNGENGILVDPGDDAGFAKAILGLIADADERKRLGSRAHAHTLERFDWSKIVVRYLEVYNALLEEVGDN